MPDPQASSAPVDSEPATRARPARPAGAEIRFWQDMSYWGARAIVAGPGTRATLTRFITQVVRGPPLRTGGVLLWRHLAGR